MPSFWDPIYVTLKQHRSLTHLRRNLNRGSLAYSFPRIVEFKDGVKQYIFKETIAYIGGAQYAYVLSKFSTFE
jgi:hypothetical protein